LIVVGGAVRDWFTTDPHPGVLALGLLLVGWVISCVWPTFSASKL